MRPVEYADWPAAKINAFAADWNAADTTAPGVAAKYGLDLVMARLLAHKLRTAGASMTKDKESASGRLPIPPKLWATLDAVSAALAASFGVPLGKVLSRTRTAPVVQCRIAVVFAGRRLGLSWKQLARYLGRPSHTSPIYLYKQATEVHKGEALRAINEMGGV